MDETLRRIIYIRSTDRKTLFFRSQSLAPNIGRGYHRVQRILYADKQEHFGFEIATDLFLELVSETGRIRTVPVPEDADFTDVPKIAGLDDRR